MMEKIFKIIHSRFFISASLILLEFIQLLVVFILLNKYSTLMVILGYIFYLGVFLYIINKYESPEFKIPWLIIIMLFSVVGAFVFILLSSNDQNKKEVEKFKKDRVKINENLKQDNSLENLKNENMDAYLQANYIAKATKRPCYENTKVSYYKIGREFHEALLESLKSAEKFIFMEYFIIEEGKMWNSIHEVLREKVKSNVKVYVIYDDFGCIKTLDERYYEKLNDEGISCVPANKFRPVLSRIHNNRDHRKITVIDGKIGFTGGINIADEYINEKVKFGHWKDTAIKIEGRAVDNLTALFLEMWNSQNKGHLDSKEFFNQNVKEIENDGVVFPYGDGPEIVYKDSIGKCIYLNMISASKKYVYITTPYLLCDYEILNALCLCAKKGVDVRIITPHIPDKKTVFLMTQSNYKNLIDNGVKIYEYTPGFIHAKQFICDDIFATCGTINLDYRSLVHHFECGTWMYNVQCIKEMKEDFLKTLEISEEISMEKARLKGLKKLIPEIMKVFFPLF